MLSAQPTTLHQLIADIREPGHEIRVGALHSVVEGTGGQGPGTVGVPLGAFLNDPNFFWALDGGPEAGKKAAGWLPVAGRAEPPPPRGPGGGEGVGWGTP